MLAKALGFYTKYFAVWVVILAVVAYCWHAFFIFVCIFTAAITAAIWQKYPTDSVSG